MSDYLDYENCRRIAYTAHGAHGDYRADGVTPYIQHPYRVSSLIEDWYERPCLKFSLQELLVARCAALLHDVVEDTLLTFRDLKYLNVQDDVIAIVEFMLDTTRALKVASATAAGF